MVLERLYELADLPRLRDVLAEPRGALRASFAFTKAPSGRAAARVAIRAEPQLVCQRCLQGFAFPVSAGSDIEFASDESGASDADRELYFAEAGHVHLRDVAEEELLLALPIAPACSTPQSCGHAPSVDAGETRSEATGDTRRPFGALQELLKKT